MKEAEKIQALRKAIETGAGRVRPAAPLRHVLCEWEVVYLLGAIAKEAGFWLYRGSDAFPDAELQVDIHGNGKLDSIRTELEYRTSRFHHNRSGCDLVICWRADARLGNLPIIELHPLFPELDAERADLEIDHEKQNPVLRGVFFEVQDWLADSMKLLPSGTGSRTQTDTVTFKDGRNSICSLQYYTASDYLQFKWFKDSLRLLGKQDAFADRLPNMLALLTAPKPGLRVETPKEYRIDIFPEDARMVGALLAQLKSIFEE